ncbi:hypothetical protein SAMD00019534_105270 [Acytostelium subglobosum LB1]|uniref:hypothetical protein n=1 Tax=Acytostelium subglobosum LB1 TaxID=1410327 RepID=UPI000644A700|nr:hypothetical protein SAMD00019534_105270 [Acytostelium subglobosum LB1]GAM27352.1 hypothetical protein SAMD00019534_105270 [Acytostelium subglobosum LB1]|eukprot:XP_012749819.1 hypothetical protein SAMD00019534_105270 [Acytostelium subglobosum LB1]
MDTRRRTNVDPNNVNIQSCLSYALVSKRWFISVSQLAPVSFTFPLRDVLFIERCLTLLSDIEHNNECQQLHIDRHWIKKVTIDCVLDDLILYELENYDLKDNAKLVVDNLCLLFPNIWQASLNYVPTFYSFNHAYIYHFGMLPTNVPFSVVVRPGQLEQFLNHVQQGDVSVKHLTTTRWPTGQLPPNIHSMTLNKNLSQRYINITVPHNKLQTTSHALDFSKLRMLHLFDYYLEDQDLATAFSSPTLKSIMICVPTILTLATLAATMDLLHSATISLTT